MRTVLMIAVICVLGRPGVMVGAAATSGANASGGESGLWDSEKYIRIAEIESGMDAYCLTEYGQAGIEKFALEVIDVVPDFNPGMDIIMVKGTDERFVHTGAVAGCSGSPVYIDGRLAGALAYGWQFSKDALYGVTSIEDMLEVGRGSGGSLAMAQTVDFSKPINLSEIGRQAAEFGSAGTRGAMGATTLPCPLITSGFSAQARSRLEDAVAGLGFMVVPGSAGSAGLAVQGGQGGGGEGGEERKLVPGACVAVPLITGDIMAGTYGTVTEVVGDRVYAFGHPFLGYGDLDLPLATAEVHMVVSSLLRSHKVCSIDRVVGALRSDEW